MKKIVIIGLSLILALALMVAVVMAWGPGFGRGFGMGPVWPQSLRQSDARAIFSDPGLARGPPERDCTASAGAAGEGNRTAKPIGELRMLTRR